MLTGLVENLTGTETIHTNPIYGVAAMTFAMIFLLIWHYKIWKRGR